MGTTGEQKVRYEEPTITDLGAVQDVTKSHKGKISSHEDFPQGEGKPHPGGHDSGEI